MHPPTPCSSNDPATLTQGLPAPPPTPPLPTPLAPFTFPKPPSHSRFKLLQQLQQLSLPLSPSVSSSPPCPLCAHISKAKVRSADQTAPPSPAPPITHHCPNSSLFSGIIISGERGAPSPRPIPPSPPADLLAAGKLAVFARDPDRTTFEFERNDGLEDEVGQFKADMIGCGMLSCVTHHTSRTV